MLTIHALFLRRAYFNKSIPSGRASRLPFDGTASIASVHVIRFRRRAKPKFHFTSRIAVSPIFQTFSYRIVEVRRKSCALCEWVRGMPAPCTEFPLSDSMQPNIALSDSNCTRTYRWMETLHSAVPRTHPASLIRIKCSDKVILRIAFNFITFTASILCLWRRNLERKIRKFTYTSMLLRPDEVRLSSAQSLLAFCVCVCYSHLRPLQGRTRFFDVKKFPCRSFVWNWRKVMMHDCIVDAFWSQKFMNKMKNEGVMALLVTILRILREKLWPKLRSVQALLPIHLAVGFH